ncbi:hypothetical protein QQ045_004028 [Rhodiola kirilowii]
MLGLNCSISAAIPKPITRNIPYSNPIRPFLLKSRKPQTRLLTLANNGDDPVTTEPANSSLFDDKNDGGGDRRPLFDIKWADLLNPDADNVLAVGLTGLLTWASVQKSIYNLSFAPIWLCADWCGTLEMALRLGSLIRSKLK